MSAIDLLSQSFIIDIISFLTCNYFCSDFFYSVVNIYIFFYFCCCHSKRFSSMASNFLYLVPQIFPGWAGVLDFILLLLLVIFYFLKILICFLCYCLYISYVRQLYLWCQGFPKKCLFLQDVFQVQLTVGLCICPKILSSYCLMDGGLLCIFFNLQTFGTVLWGKTMIPSYHSIFIQG